MTASDKERWYRKMNDARDQFLKGIGGNLRRQMEALDVSTEQLAAITAISQARIEMILAAEAEVGALELMGLARGLGIVPDELLEGLEHLAPGPVLAESKYELPILKAYSGGRDADARPVEESVRELIAPRLSESDHTVLDGGQEVWITLLRNRRRRLLDAGLVGFDPRLRVWDLTERGEARLRELELSQGEGTDATAGPSRPVRGAGDKHDGRSEHR